MPTALFFTSSHQHTSITASQQLGYEIECEYSYRIDHNEGIQLEWNMLSWLLSPYPHKNSLFNESQLRGRILQIGPHEWQRSAFCSNAMSIFSTIGMEGVTRIERYRRYLIPQDESRSDQELLEVLGDKMTESIINDNNPTVSAKTRNNFQSINVLGDGEDLKKANVQLGLAFDDEDLKYYQSLFRDKIKRNPTDVELTDIANADSEHSRHWFFRGALIPEGSTDPLKESLMDKIKQSLNHSNRNNLIAFSDNSSAIRGFDHLPVMLPSDPTQSSQMSIVKKNRHIVYTAETHNFPTAVCPFEGAATGTGGRMRDNHSTGRGAHEIAGVAGYSFGNLHLPDYPLPWEDNAEYPSTFAHPRTVAIQASNGASDYGNKFGEPVICGFARSFGMKIKDRRIEYLKPIMFSGGIGSIDEECIKKEVCSERMLVAKIGGPVYRIGMGGGAASSVSVQGSREGSIDYSAVQRGDAQAGHKLHRLVRACAELGECNPILSIHDQGAGGNGNVLKEIVEPCGAVFESNSFTLGDETISVRELWTAEYQENDAILIVEESLPTLERISQRENCTFNVVGRTTKDPRVVLRDFGDNSSSQQLPVDFSTEILNEKRTKTFNLRSTNIFADDIQLDGVTVTEALQRVLRLPSVSSKRYLTSKVDRSVTGLIAQQQCVGPLQTPLADVAVVALSHFSTKGAAIAVGEQPIKMLASVTSGVEMTLAECLSNLVFAHISDIKDVKLSGNWMWSKNEDGGRLTEAVHLLCHSMQQIGVAIDGGKDSLSMTAATTEGSVSSPGTLVLTAYVPCPDIRRVVTPDLKDVEDSVILYVRMDGGTTMELGGTAIAQVYGQLGREAPRIDSWDIFGRVFGIVQSFIKDDKILAGHDVSDGGVLVALLEMAFAGNCGIEANFHFNRGTLETLFNENSAIILQLSRAHAKEMAQVLENVTTVCQIGQIRTEKGPDAKVLIKLNDIVVEELSLVDLRESWEETSTRLDMIQTNPKCVRQSEDVRRRVKQVKYKAEFSYSISTFNLTNPATVIVLREEGSNGDREMAAAFHLSGFTTLDVTTNDLLLNPSILQNAKGLAFVGGFSFSDVLGSAKGWAARILHNKELSLEMERFRQREDSFSLGVCNGCQLMALLGWVGSYENRPSVFLDANESGKFESTFASVEIRESSSILLKGMEGSVLGVWSAHGEGRFSFRDEKAKEALKEYTTMKYVDENNHATEEYPWNPNGSQDGIAAICSEDGRHLAMMPHAERCFLQWQWPTPYFNAPECTSDTPPSPWMRLFTNAARWVYGTEYEQ